MINSKCLICGASVVGAKYCTPCENVKLKNEIQSLRAELLELRSENQRLSQIADYS
jgi:hypothetical protein